MKVRVATLTRMINAMRGAPSVANPTAGKPSVGAPAPRDADDQHHLLCSELAGALENDDIYVVYQPKLDLRTGRYAGVETLLRWLHPVRGQIDPSGLIASAEASGQIHDLSQWVLGRAIADQRMIAASAPGLCFHVNISGESLRFDDFIDKVCRAAQAASGPVGLEITETAFIADPRASFANLNRLVAAGIRVSIDDYGSGHSSLAYLKELPADEIKIDKLFVSGMTRSNRDPLIVRSTIDLAHALGMRVVAEGVESNAALALLRAMGCDMAQGYFISPPLRLGDLAPFLDDAAHLARLNNTDISLTPPQGFWDRTGHGTAGAGGAGPEE